MFRIIDMQNNMTPVKSGFKTSAQANNWAKKNLPKDEVCLWGSKVVNCSKYRYRIQMK